MKSNIAEFEKAFFVKQAITEANIYSPGICNTMSVNMTKVLSSLGYAANYSVQKFDNGEIASCFENDNSSVIIENGNYYINCWAPMWSSAQAQHILKNLSERNYVLNGEQVTIKVVLGHCDYVLPMAAMIGRGSEKKVLFGGLVKYSLIQVQIEKTGLRGYDTLEESREHHLKHSNPQCHEDVMKTDWTELAKLSPLSLFLSPVDMAVREGCMFNPDVKFKALNTTPELTRKQATDLTILSNSGDNIDSLRQLAKKIQAASQAIAQKILMTEIG
jgi:hypothetical protein